MKVTMTTMTDTKVKEMIAKVLEYGGAMTSDQLQTMIEGIQGEDGRGEKYKDVGAGLGGTVKGGGAGLGGTVKGAGTGRGHGSKDIDTSYSYPLAYWPIIHRGQKWRNRGQNRGLYSQK